MTDYLGQCSGCDRKWNNTGQAHCTIEGCHRQFSNTRAFDLHLGRIPASGPQRCKDPAKLRTRDGDPVLVERDGVWRRPGEYRPGEVPSPGPGAKPAARTPAGASLDASSLGGAL